MSHVSFARVSSLIFGLIFCLTGSASQAAQLSFSGGGGTPLTITLAQPVTYTITTGPAAPIFDFKTVGNIFGGTLNLSGSLTYTINGGSAITINAGDTGFSSGAIASNDLIMFHNPSSDTVTTGDTVVLSAGSVTTAINIPAAAPANGSYTAILADATTGNQIAVGVPEPAVGLSVLGLTVLAFRRRRAI